MSFLRMDSGIFQGTMGSLWAENIQVKHHKSQLDMESILEWLYQCHSRILLGNPEVQW